MNDLQKLVGRTIKKIYMNEDYLKFETDQGNLVYEVDGDCCSESVFYDFIGVKKLLDNGKVISVKAIDLEVGNDKKMYQEEVIVYGYEIVTEDPKFGEVTSVVSFRNYSNGYYGGSMNETTDFDVEPEITDDVLETESSR